MAVGGIPKKNKKQKNNNKTTTTTKKPRHYVQRQLRFCQAWANFGWAWAK